MQINLTAQASPDDMGAAVGRGLQSVGQGLGQIADAAWRKRDLEDTNLAKDAYNRLAAIDRDLQYGDNGFMLLEGRAAVDGQKGYEDALNEARRSIGAELPPGAAQLFDRAADERLYSSMTSAAIQSANGHKKWFADETAARQNTFKEDAVAAWARPDEVTKQIALGQVEIRQQGEMMGWGADTLKNQEVQYISDVRQAVAQRIMVEDPIKAQAYIDANRDQLTGIAQKELAEKLDVPLSNAKGLQAAANYPMQGRSFDTPDNAGQGPTNARAYLLTHSVTQGRDWQVNDLDGAFANNLAAMMQDSPFPGLGLLSGNRTNEEQAKLFDAEVARQGGDVAAARHNVAPPGHSNHNHGTAVDISYNGQSLSRAPKEVVDWVHANAGKYGLNFPMSWEPWHVEPNGTRSTAVAATGITTPAANAPSRTDMEKYLQTIADPRERQVARSAIMAQMQSAASDAEAQRKQIGQQAFSEMVTQNVSPFSFAPEVQSALGIENMNSLTSYWEKMASGEKIVTNDALLYEMQKAYAADPVEFAKQDLLQYRSQLSDADWKSATGWQQTALTDQRKAGEDGIKLNAAFSAATTALEAAGITTTGKKDKDRIAAAKQIAQFNNMLAQQMEAFKQQNERAPNEVEIQSMTNKLLLPVVIKPTQVDDGMFGNHFFGIGLPSDTKGFMFEVPNRPDNTQAVSAVPYAEIPLDLRNTIRTSLTTDLGRDPTEEEIAAEYAVFYLDN
ncbi:MAG: M15 family metallopeptidase [Devosia sp.]